ncbi:MAG TPA: M24 family metallopeptidase [Gemmatimonadales bacterium]|nr:M24 family metallopeptidase [Gemmatimonadales bacterium]
MTPSPLEGLDLAALGQALGELGADAWLLWDFRRTNPVMTRILGARALGLGTRRLFIFLPRAGRPVAIAHRIEAHTLAGFPGDVRPYAAWRELMAELRCVVAGRTVAMEISDGDAVPYLDRVPRGVVQLVEALGGRVVPSANLVTRFAARWTEDELQGHRRAASALADIATEALRWAGAETARGAEVREVTLQGRVLGAMERAGLRTEDAPIAAFQENSALPHYEPREGSDRRLQAGHVILLDLWARASEGVWADQTWMGYVGRAPDAEVRRVWDAVRRARDGVVGRLRDQWPGAMTGGDLDDVARGVIHDAGYGAFFVHRTGHSIDRDLHGSGPHLDNFETADSRPLLPGIGFSVEPGIYLPGRFGVRSEINVYLHEDAPEVTPASPQTDLLLV